MIKRLTVTILILALLLLSGCTPKPFVPDGEFAEVPDTPAFTAAVWMPYMEVEEFLSSGDANTAKAAIAAAMQDCADRGIDTVFFHVRANSDAYYNSSVFAVNPSAKAVLEGGLDPLACAVEEAHARGLQLHAWINPYRIGSDASRARCDAVFSHNDRWYYIPTSPDAVALIVDGVREVLEGYAVDGVQFDDYFYPEGALDAYIPAAFEEEAFAKADMPLAQWRRDAVSELVAQVCALCRKQENVVFGISPSYDIERNREEMYADVERWAREHTFVDYLCPQLYVGFNNQYASFITATSAWSAMPRSASVSLYGGLAFYKTGMPEDTYAGTGKTEWANGGDILARQAAMLQISGWQGIALYSHQSFAVDGERDAAVVQAEWAALYEEIS